MGTSVSGNPPLTATTTPTTRKRPRPHPLPSSPAPDSNPNPNSKQRHLLIPSPHLETPPTKPNSSLLHSDSIVDSSLPLIRPTSPPENSLIPNPNPNPSPNPTSVPSSLPMASLADLESSLDMAASPPNSPGCMSEEADLVIAEMMQSLVRVIENAVPVPALVKPLVESSRSLASAEPESQGVEAAEEEEIAKPEVVALDLAATGDWAVEEEFGEEEFGENCDPTLADHNVVTVDASEDDDDETAKLKGSLGPVMLLSSDLQRMLEASDAELGIVETAAAAAAVADDEEEVDEQSAAAACRRAEELDLVHELADAAEEEGGGVVVNDGADLVEEWGRMISSSSSSLADSSRKSTGNGNGSHANCGLDEEIIDLYDDAENLEPWDLDPDVLDSIDEAWGRDGELDLLLISRELNSSVV